MLRRVPRASTAPRSARGTDRMFVGPVLGSLWIGAGADELSAALAPRGS
jgi:hypothetical protein